MLLVYGWHTGLPYILVCQSQGGSRKTEHVSEGSWRLIK